MKKNKDLLGRAMMDYQNEDHFAKITVHCDLGEPETVPVSYFFREFEDFPEIEKKAIQLSYGNILDIGAGSGSHSLFLQSNKKKVTSLDSSLLSVEVMKKRGLKNIIHSSILDHSTQKYDTLLLLMNGIGIAKTLKGLEDLFEFFSHILAKKGQILLDSSDVHYLYEEEDGSRWMDLNSDFYGEVQYQVEYKGEKDEWFPWLFVDFETLSKIANHHDYQCFLEEEGSHFQYLARIIKK